MAIARAGAAQEPVATGSWAAPAGAASSGGAGYQRAAWRGDVGAYLVGALDSDARARVIAHLETCAGCRSDYDELISVRGLLSQLAGPDAAPRAGGAGRFWGQPPGGAPLPPLRPVRPGAGR